MVNSNIFNNKRISQIEEQIKIKQNELSLIKSKEKEIYLLRNELGNIKQKKKQLDADEYKEKQFMFELIKKYSTELTITLWENDKALLKQKNYDDEYIQINVMK